MSDALSHTLSHPLFPVDEDTEDDEIKPISFISVSRLENGRSVVAPRQRSASELQSLEQLHAEFGGGSYVLRAFHAGRIVTQRKYELPGKSLPLFDQGIEEKPAQAVPVATPANPMIAMMGGAGEGGFMGFLVMMMQQLMQQSAQAQQQQTQMFIAMMNNQHSSSAEEKAAARAELAANVERERINSQQQMSFMKELMQARSGGGSSDDFTKGVEFMRSFANQQIEMAKLSAKGEDSGDGLMSLLDTLGTAFQAAQAVGMFKGSGVPEGVQQVAEVAEVARG